jgi:hypothetical protein
MAASKWRLRFPLVRSGDDFDRPIEWWEWLFYPIIVPLFILFLIVIGVLLIPFYWLYPERHMADVDIDATDKEKRELKRFRMYRARVSCFRRLLERFGIVEFDAPPPRKSRL